MVHANYLIASSAYALQITSHYYDSIDRFPIHTSDQNSARRDDFNVFYFLCVCVCVCVNNSIFFSPPKKKLL